MINNINYIELEMLQTIGKNKNSCWHFSFHIKTIFCKKVYNCKPCCLRKTKSIYSILHFIFYETTSKQLWHFQNIIISFLVQFNLGYMNIHIALNLKQITKFCKIIKIVNEVSTRYYVWKMINK